MNPQKKPTKPCPTCDTGKVLTGDWSKHNAVVNGKQVCPDCMIHNLYAKHLDKKD
jgi:ribosomal protein S27AE